MTSNVPSQRSLQGAKPKPKVVVIKSQGQDRWCKWAKWVAFQESREMMEMEPKGEPWPLSKRAPSSCRLLPSGFVGSSITRSSGIYFTAQAFTRNLPKCQSVWALNLTHQQVVFICGLPACILGWQEDMLTIGRLYGPVERALECPTPVEISVLSPVGSVSLSKLFNVTELNFLVCKLGLHHLCLAKFLG